MNKVFFFDARTGKPIQGYVLHDNWEFKVGQKFHGFWGFDSTVTKVELEMTLVNNELGIWQRVWVDRVPLNY